MFTRTHYRRKIFHFLFRFLEYILLIKEQISWILRWWMKLIILSKKIEHKSLHRNSKNCYGIYYSTTFVQVCWQDAINEWYRLLMQFVKFGEFYGKNINLTILDNYARKLLFVYSFLVYWKIWPESRASRIII